MLALTNSQYNGGFTYAGYQWYKNNAPLPGQTGSYLYLGEGAALSAGDEYRVAITRADGSTLMSCPYTPKSSKPQIGVYPTIVGSNERITITIVGKGIATLWSTGGILLRTFKLDGHTEVIAPSEEGIYLLQVIDDESKQAFRVVVSTK